MNSDRTAIFGGIIILAGGLSLAVYANMNADALSQAKARTVSKYIQLSEKALSKGESHQAEKFVIKALKADPSNKEAISAFKKVEFSLYQPAVGTGAEKTPNGTGGSVPKPIAPSPEEDAEDEMGCI